MTGELSRRPARWKYSIGEDADYLQIDEKTLEALLQLDIEHVIILRSIDGRGLMVMISVVIYSSVKYHSLWLYVLISKAKT